MIDDSELERAIKERQDFERRFNVTFWSVMLIMFGLFLWVVLR